MNGPLPSAVVVVNDAANVTGGAGKVALSSAIGLARAGVAVTVFSAQGPVAPELAAEPGITVVCLQQDDILSDPRRARAAVRGVWNVSAQRALSRVLAAHDPAATIVHVHGWTKALSSSVFRAATSRDFPLVLTLHDYFLACPIGSMYRHPKQTICTIPAMSARCVVENCDSRNYAQKAWRVARQAVQSVAGIPPKMLPHVITISDLSEEVLSPYFPADTTVHRVENPIDVVETAAVDVAENASFLYVGRLSPEKGAHLFADAAYTAGVPAVFVGDGESAERVRAVNPYAVVTGWVAHEAMKDYLGTARAVVLPSLWNEPFGLVALEAAACGVPAIVADTCGARADIVEGVTGLTFRSGDRDDLARQLRRLNDAAFARELGAAAFRRYWDAPRSMTRHVDALLDVYRRMLSANEAGPGAAVESTPRIERQRAETIGAASAEDEALPA